MRHLAFARIPEISACFNEQNLPGGLYDLQYKKYNGKESAFNRNFFVLLRVITAILNVVGNPFAHSTI